MPRTLGRWARYSPQAPPTLKFLASKVGLRADQLDVAVAADGHVPPTSVVGLPDLLVDPAWHAVKRDRHGLVVNDPIRDAKVFALVECIRLT